MCLGVATVKPLNEMVYPQPAQAAALLNELGFAIDDDSDRRRWRKWVVVIILALLCHLLMSLYHMNWEAASPPMPVDINPVDPAKLDAIRKQWRDKSILIDKGAKAAAEAPKDARYFSDKNIRVEKEQRARDTNVLPRPGAPGPMGESKPQEKAQPKPQLQNPVMPLPNLGNLGVPMHLDRKPPPQEVREKQNGEQQFHGNDGGDQAVLDRALPPGSENMLNAEESVFYSFYARMYESIAPVWQSRIREVAGSQRVAAGEYTTQVDVVLDHNGNLLGVRRMHSSGVDAFDRAVDAALSKTGHFPNPPKALLNESGEIHTGWTFTVSLQQGTGYSFEPPERVY